MRWKCVFKFFFSRQQTDSRQQTSADRGPKKSIIVVLSLHVQCCTYWYTNTYSWNMVKLFCALSSFTAVSLLHLTVSHTPTQNLRQNENHHHDDHTQQQQQQQQQQQHPIFAQEPQDQYTYTDDAQKDQIISLPGLNFQPDFNQFSGYIPVSDTRNIHYWYIESSNNPSTDPVVFWTSKSM